jgi:hypothetical protein
VNKTLPPRTRRSQRRGVLTLEWIMLITILGIGILGALGAVRNALIKEFCQLTQCVCDVDIGP